MQGAVKECGGRRGEFTKEAESYHWLYNTIQSRLIRHGYRIVTETAVRIMAAPWLVCLEIAIRASGADCLDPLGVSKIENGEEERIASTRHECPRDVSRRSLRVVTYPKLQQQTCQSLVQEIQSGLWSYSYEPPCHPELQLTAFLLRMVHQNNVSGSSSVACHARDI